MLLYIWSDMKYHTTYSNENFCTNRIALLLLQDSDDTSLETVLKAASMDDDTVILTTLNEAWADPNNSILDLFLTSFRLGYRTSRLLNHLVIITLDQKAYASCKRVHTHCFALATEGVDFSREAYFMTPDYLKMMWRRIDFLRSVLEMGYNFLFTVILSLSLYLSHTHSHYTHRHIRCCH